MNDAQLRRIEQASDELRRGGLRFCTRCGSEVGPYQPRVSLGEHESWGIYDKPIDTDDELLQTGPAAYWCPKCEAKWKAVGWQDTGSLRPCGHFMPLYADYCAACGQRTGGQAESDKASGPACT